MTSFQIRDEKNRIIPGTVDFAGQLIYAKKVKKGNIINDSNNEEEEMDDEPKAEKDPQDTQEDNTYTLPQSQEPEEGESDQSQDDSSNDETQNNQNSPQSDEGDPPPPIHTMVFKFDYLKAYLSKIQENINFLKDNYEIFDVSCVLDEESKTNEFEVSLSENNLIAKDRPIQIDTHTARLYKEELVLVFHNWQSYVLFAQMMI